MRNAAIVADENSSLEQGSEVRQRQVFGKPNRFSVPRLFELRGSRRIRFAGDDD
jgi:hypothetical protein